MAFEVGQRVQARLIGYANGKPVYVATCCGSGGDNTFLAQLICKDYDPDGLAFITYSWVKVFDSDDPVALTYIEAGLTGSPGTGLSGGPHHMPAYQLQNLDVPVHELCTGTGSVSGPIKTGSGSLTTFVLYHRLIIFPNSFAVKQKKFFSLLLNLNIIKSEFN